MPIVLSQMKYIFALVFSLFCAKGSAAGKSVRGVDFRMQLNSSTLNYTGISGIPRTFFGFGAELASHLYFLDQKRWRGTAFFSTRLTNYTGQNMLAGERDDVQAFTLAPGIEIGYGPLYLQGSYRFIKMNSYFVSTNSADRTVEIVTPGLATGLNFRLGHLGIGLGASWIKAPVSAEKRGLPGDEASTFDDLTYSLNLIYYISKPPKKFIKELF